MTYLVKKPTSDVQYAALTIPVEVRHVIGKVRFFQSTKTKNEAEAARRAAVLVAGWKVEIAKAREKAPNPKDTFWESLKRQYVNTDDEGVQIAIEELAESMAAKEEDPNQAAHLYKLTTNQAGTLLAPLVEEWKKSLRVSQKTIDQQGRDVTRMAEHFLTLETIKPQKVKAWTDKLITQGTTATSLERIGNGCHSLWRYLQNSGAIPMDTPDPFLGSFRLGIRTSKRVTVERKAFTAKELSDIYQQAVNNEDATLARVIALGAFTGARIEEICSLTVGNCADGIFTITDSKTDAGVRQIPIHPKLVPLVKAMTKESTDGYLVPSKAAGQYGVRSDPYSKRFGRLKEAMGFGPGHVFHSIRKTVATQLEQAGVKEGIAADILGHEKKTLSYGVYSEGSSMEQKLKAVSKVAYPGALGKP